MTDAPAPLRIPLADGASLSGLLDGPADARVGLVLAHGAGADMHHPSMVALATGLAARGVAVLRYQFPYTERGGRRPDVPAVAQAAVRAAVAAATTLRPRATWYAGGRSFGGRMTSQAQAQEPLAGIAGLVFVAFPLHAAGKPGSERAAHLARVHVPMLFLQGDRDALAELGLLRAALAPLGDRATLVVFDDADHGFHVRARSGQTDDGVRERMLAAMTGWFARVAGPTRRA